MSPLTHCSACKNRIKSPKWGGLGPWMGHHWGCRRIGRAPDLRLTGVEHVCYGGHHVNERGY